MLKRNLNSMSMSLVELLVGILLMVNPVGFTSGIIVICGVVLTLVGTFDVFKYFYNEPQKAAISQFLSRGLLEILSGAFCVFYSQWFLVTFPMLTVVYGVANLITGVTKLQWTIDMIRLKRSRWLFLGISAVISLLCGFVVIANPFSTAAVLWMFIGISLIVEATLDLVGSIFGNREKQEENL